MMRDSRRCPIAHLGGRSQLAADESVLLTLVSCPPVPQIDTALLKVEDQNTATFKPLLGGGEYCVSVRIEDKTSKTISEVSPKQCVLLPEQGSGVTATFLKREPKRHRDIVSHICPALFFVPQNGT